MAGYLVMHSRIIHFVPEQMAPGEKSRTTELHEGDTVPIRKGETRIRALRRRDGKHGKHPLSRKYVAQRN